MKISLKPSKKLPLKYLSMFIKMFEDYFKSHFENTDTKTEIGQKRLILKSWFRWFNKFK